MLRRSSVTRVVGRCRSSLAGARIVGVQVGFRGGLNGWRVKVVKRFWNLFGGPVRGILFGRWAAKGAGERGSGLGIGMRLARSAMEREMGGEFRCVGNVYCGGRVRVMTCVTTVGTGSRASELSAQTCTVRTAWKRAELLPTGNWDSSRKSPPESGRSEWDDETPPSAISSSV